MSASAARPPAPSPHSTPGRFPTPSLRTSGGLEPELRGLGCTFPCGTEGGSLSQKWGDPRPTKQKRLFPPDGAPVLDNFLDCPRAGPGSSTLSTACAQQCPERCRGLFHVTQPAGDRSGPEHRPGADSKSSAQTIKPYSSSELNPTLVEGSGWGIGRVQWAGRGSLPPSGDSGSSAAAAVAQPVPGQPRDPARPWWGDSVLGGC